MPKFTRKVKRIVQGLLRPTVIIVDREPLYRWFVSQSLDARGLHVVQCSTLEDAATCVRRGLSTDLLLVDEQTVQEGGVAAVDRLRLLSRSIPCLVLDSLAPGSARADLGDATLVQKPVDSRTVVALLDIHLFQPARSAQAQSSLQLTP